MIPGRERTICHLTFTPVRFESRAFRAAASALKSNEAQRVLLIGYQEDDLPARDQLMPGGEIIRLKQINIRGLPRVVTRSLQWLAWNLAAVRTLWRQEVSLIQSHSLAGLPAGVLLKWRKKIPLIYDAHELETERNGWGFVQKAGAKWLERIFIRYCDHVLLVSDNILDWYRANYRVRNMSVVRNAPQVPDEPIERNRLLRDEFNIPDDHLVFLYLGNIGEGRGFRQIIDAFRGLPSDRHMIFVGAGADTPQVDMVSQIADRLPNIHWRRPVPTSQVIKYAAGADVGISFFEDTCLSHRYCLPNKLHEYRLAGLPVIVSDLPEMARYVDEAACGWKVKFDANCLRALISNIDRDAVTKKRNSVRMPPLTWETEGVRYVEVLHRLLDAAPASQDS